MFYDSVLTYVRTVLDNSHIPSSILTEPYENIETLDLGLRESLFSDFDKEEAFRIFTEKCESNTLYYCTDTYHCSYVVMLLPNPDQKQYFFIGPFTYVEIKQKNLLSLIEELKISVSLLPILKNYYYNLAFIDSENHFKNLIGTLADTIWPGNPGYSVSVIDGNPWDIPDGQKFIVDLEQSYLLPMNITAIETRYEFENRCIQAGSQGNISVIEQLCTYGNSVNFIPRLHNSLRDYKNYMIIINTLLRKAAEQSDVHPVYLDQLSGEFAKKIEVLTLIPNHTLEIDTLLYCFTCPSSVFTISFPPLFSYLFQIENHFIQGMFQIFQLTFRNAVVNTISPLFQTFLDRPLRFISLLCQNNLLFPVIIRIRFHNQVPSLPQCLQHRRHSCL